MSGSGPDEPGFDGSGSDRPFPDDRDLDAAEYVMGLLTPDEARAIEALAKHEPQVAASIVAWENRLGPLATTLTPLFPPPELWQRLALASGLQKAFARKTIPRRSTSAKIWQSAALWRTTTVASLGLAAGLAFLVLGPRAAGPEPLLAALSAQGTPGAVFLVRVGDKGQTSVVAVGRAVVPAGRTLELWALPEGATTPVSLGILPGGGRTRLKANVRAGTRLLVSQEPNGGSPTGQPTGPVVYAGLLISS